MNVISPDIDVEPVIFPDVGEVWLNVARVEIYAPLFAKIIAKCFSNHSERYEFEDIFKELGNGSKFNWFRISLDENIPQEVVGIPISASGCKSNIESEVLNWMKRAKIKEMMSAFGKTWS